ncbi:class V lanthionine synthetase subunit LxmK [Streptomyces sp. NPDC048595]|uniref:class V lanthionine synthetase subunit LxmK n=1 Tax=Streptomyces sp. NPDC048595 TaxID=3365576 RepID=UPI003721C5C7
MLGVESGSNEIRSIHGKEVVANLASVVQSAGLDAVPEVDMLLARIGVGHYVRDSVSMPVGRNHAWTGQTQSGRQVFVKRLVGPDLDVQARMVRILAFEEFVGKVPELASHMPTLLGFDRGAGLVAFDHVTAKSGHELMVDETFSEELAYSVGQKIGALHAASPIDGMDDTLPRLPDPELLNALPLAMYNGLSFAELEAWHLMQHDVALREGLENLRRWEEAAPRCPAHCDLRVDQLLICDDGLPIITDWEEFRLADPARDVGAFAGEWLYRSVLDIVTCRSEGHGPVPDVELTHEQVLASGVQRMERLLPLVHWFWRGYRMQRAVDPDFPVRATAFAGWHMLDRLIAGAAGAQALSGIARAAAGIGRGALIAPHEFAGLLGFEEAQ